MTTIALLISLALFAGFNLLTIGKSGLLPSYSATYYHWMRTSSISTFSVVTFLVSLLLMPAMIEQGEGSVLQFLGFFAPIYLIIVAIRPDFEADHKTYLIHSGAAIVCALCSFAWVVFVRRLWWVLLVGIAASALLGLATRTLKSSKTFWLEMVMFVSVYTALLV